MCEKLVSVVVPIYDVEKYICQCVDSIINQTYKNLEIILVDDGSPDNCPEICDEYAEKDNRVKVIHKKNGGQAFAREAGILNATGDYVIFIDGDDWIDLETVEKCLDKALETNADCVMFSYVKENETSSALVKVLDKEQSLIGEDAKDKVYRRLFGLLDFELRHPERAESVGSCCLKLYKIDLVKKAKYFDIKKIGSSEDVLFNMYALYGAQRIEYLDKHFYHYRRNLNSLTSTYRPKLVEQWNTLYDIIEGIIEEKWLSNRYKKALYSRIALSIVGIGMNELSSKSSARQKRKNIARYLKSNRYKEACKEFSLRELPFIWKIFMWCCKHRFALAVYLQLKVMKKLKNR